MYHMVVRDPVMGQSPIMGQGVLPWKILFPQSCQLHEKSLIFLFFFWVKFQNRTVGLAVSTVELPGP
jgi:hypothetical protein